jgi:hypothetical protein
MSATLRQPLTKSGRVEGARHVVLPGGITSSGLPATQATCAEIGLGFDRLAG